MKFEAMMSFWKMKEMIHQPSCQTRTLIYDTDDKHVVYCAEIRDFPRNGSMKAQIVYRYTERSDGLKSGYALIYADLVFTGWQGSSTDQIFIKNAKVSDLKHHMIEQL